MFVTVLVWVRQQGLLSVRLLDISFGARCPYRFEAEDVVECGDLTSSDAVDRLGLFWRRFPLLVSLSVFAVAGGSCPDIRSGC